jgi:lysophospholipase L1-like esterase
MRFAVATAMLSLATLQASTAAAAATKVACVGDSITQLSGWPEKLGVRLGPGYTSTNYGLAGTTLLKNGDHPYWTTQQFTDSHAANPDIVVIMLGTNDSKPFNWSPHGSEFVGDYEALIDSYASLPSHPRIYLNLCPPAGTNGYQIVGSVIENQVNPDIKQVAAAKGRPTIDIFDAFGGHDFDPSLYGSTADQVHPNAKGAQVIADTVYAALTAVAVDGGMDADAAPEAGLDGAAAGGSSDAGASSPEAASGDTGGTDTPGADASGIMGGGLGTAGGSGGTSTGAGGSAIARSGAMADAGPSPRASAGGCALGGDDRDAPWARLPIALLALWGAASRRPLRSRGARCQLGA